MESSANAPSTLRDLTGGLARGDDVAWAEFHRDYGPGIFRHLLAETRGDHDLASEALQQTYLRVARHARPCEAEPMFRAWLRVVTRSALLDCWRRRRSFWQRLQHPFAAPEESSVADPAAGTDAALTEALDAALATLDPDDRGLLQQKYFSGLPVRTIAENLGLTPKAVESRLTRARAELRRILVSSLKRHD